MLQLPHDVKALEEKQDYLINQKRKVKVITK